MSPIRWALRQARDLARDRFGVHVFRGLSRGWDMFNDMATHLPNLKIGKIYDVGANIGDTALDFQARFPDAEIVCFEPVMATYLDLKSRIEKSGKPRITCHQLALSSKTGQGHMLYGEVEGVQYSDLNRLSTTGEGDEQVPVTTVDAFAAGEDCKRIGLLKIDTEGGDLEVLRGAARLLGDNAIDLIQVEAGFSSTNSVHVPFAALQEHLRQYDYHPFGIYQQVNEWTQNLSNLRRADVIFVSRRTLDKNVAPS